MAMTSDSKSLPDAMAANPKWSPCDHQADASMVMLLIVPVEEAAAERLGILDTAEALWELGLVFHGFEVAFRERIVVGRMRPAVGFGDAEIGEQERRGLGSHGTATVGMQGQLAGRHGMLGDGIVEQCPEQGRAFSVGDAPADNSSAEGNCPGRAGNFSRSNLK